MYTVKEISSYFLSLSDPESGEGITHLKLQKLCYYAQGFHLAMFDVPLFLDHIEAWQHGPVIPNLYREYKSQGDQAIQPHSIELSRYSDAIRSFLDEIYETYGQFSAWKLRDMTHNEIPWIQASENPTSDIISNDTMKDYFKTLLVNNS
jgi:uncharacterized phage-associated protein